MTGISGVASSSQLASMRQAMFSSMDTDGSGTVSQDEFVAARPDDVSETDASNLYASMDTDGTNALTEDQLDAGMEANKPDNSDTSGLSTNLSSDLISSLMQLLQNMQTGAASATTADSSSSDSTSSVSSATGSPPSAADMFSAMDADGDGSVTEAEFVSARPSDMSEEQATSLYNSIDTEGTGSITETQLADSMGAPQGPPPPPPEDSETVASSTDTSSDTSSSSSTSSTTSSSSSSSANTTDLLAQLLEAIKAYQGQGYSSNLAADATSLLEATA